MASEARQRLMRGSDAVIWVVPLVARMSRKPGTGSDPSAGERKAVPLAPEPAVKAPAGPAKVSHVPQDAEVPEPPRSLRLDSRQSGPVAEAAMDQTTPFLESW